MHLSVNKRRLSAAWATCPLMIIAEIRLRTYGNAFDGAAVALEVSGPRRYLMGRRIFGNLR